MHSKLNLYQDMDTIKDDKYKYPSTVLTKSIMTTKTESSDSTRFETYRKKSAKRVTFNRYVTIVNIQSHKKDIRKHNYQKYTTVFEEDFDEDEKQNCFNCNIF